MEIPVPEKPMLTLPVNKQAKKFSLWRPSTQNFQKTIQILWRSFCFRRQLISKITQLCNNWPRHLFFVLSGLKVEVFALWLRYCKDWKIFSYFQTNLDCTSKRFSTDFVQSKDFVWKLRLGQGSWKLFCLIVIGLQQQIVGARRLWLWMWRHLVVQTHNKSAFFRFFPLRPRHLPEQVGQRYLAWVQQVMHFLTRYLSTVRSHSFCSFMIKTVTQD